MAPLRVINPEYELYDKEIRSFSQFLPQTSVFWKSRRLTPFILSRNSFFITHKNLYMGPLRVTDPEYELYDHEIWNFVQFFP
jgi:hypothetical protein